jgi:RNA polymerase sigma-70 factor (ECF subfamily)
MRGGDPLADAEPLLRRVYAYVAYRVADRTEAEDITSETFERALRYRDSFDASKGDPAMWLLGIARNCVYDARLRTREVRAELEASSDAGFEEEVLGRLALREALATLGDGDRELLALRYGADLRPREIGRLLERRTNAVEVALSRARARLAAALDRVDEPVRRSQPGPLADVSDGAL